jgi:hypothetical protein
MVQGRRISMYKDNLIRFWFYAWKKEEGRVLLKHFEEQNKKNEK